MFRACLEGCFTWAPETSAAHNRQASFKELGSTKADPGDDRHPAAHYLASDADSSCQLSTSKLAQRSQRDAMLEPSMHEVTDVPQRTGRKGSKGSETSETRTQYSITGMPLQVADMDSQRITYSNSGMPLYPAEYKVHDSQSFGDAAKEPARRPPRDSLLESSMQDATNAQPQIERTVSKGSTDDVPHHKGRKGSKGSNASETRTQYSITGMPLQVTDMDSQRITYSNSGMPLYPAEYKVHDSQSSGDAAKEPARRHPRDSLLESSMQDATGAQPQIERTVSKGSDVSTGSRTQYSITGMPLQVSDTDSQRITYSNSGMPLYPAEHKVNGSKSSGEAAHKSARRPSKDAIVDIPELIATPQRQVSVSSRASNEEKLIAPNYKVVV